MDREKEMGKKLLIIYIISILRRFSDENHPLSQQRILELLESEYGMNAERKSIRRNLARLQEAGLPVVCREAARVTHGKKSAISLDWYWRHGFSEEELRTLLDVLYFSHLPQQKIRQITEKLEWFRSSYFDAEKAAVRNLPHPMYLPQAERQRPLAASLARAITEKKKVTFYYDHYEADGKRHPDRGMDGSDRLHKVNPYSLVSADGHYFLIGNDDGEETVRLYRVLRMSGLTVLEEAQRPSRSVAALENGLYPSQYISAQSQVFFGMEERCTLDVMPDTLTELMEDFGKRVFIRSATAQWVQAEVTASFSEMAAWAMLRGEKVRVTGPPLLVHQMKQTVGAMYKLYGGD